MKEIKQDRSAIQQIKTAGRDKRFKLSCILVNIFKKIKVFHFSKRNRLMKNSVPTNLEKLRISQGPMASDPSCGFNGAFIIPYCNVRLFVIVSDEMGWDHVSVSTAHRCPTWTEMCFVKRLFFDPEETVLQYHPAESQYINNHPNVLHLWRKQGTAVELPLIIMV